MKQVRLVLMLSIAILLLSGCDKLKEKRFSTTIPYDFEVEITEGVSTQVDMSGELTSLINEELNKVKEDIQRYELVSIEYKIWEFYGNTPNTFAGTLGFGNANATEPGVIHEYNDIDLQAGSDSQNRVKMNLNSQDIARIQQYFMDTNGMKMFFKGDVTSAPVHFKMQLVVNIDAIAEVEKK